MDMKMPGIGGLEATKKILQHNPAIKIIALTSCTEEPYPSKVLKIGAAGYLSKETNLEEILLAIKTVCAGKTYICPAVAQKLALKSVQGEEFPIDQLSGRELQIMLMVAKGQEAKSIAQLLFLSPKTVNSYRYRVFKKLGVKGNVELTHFAARHGILDAELN
jgi:two-component system, NarL family, invasion response regulator UvrY